MKLLLTKGWTGEQELISENPTEQEVSRLLNSLEWQNFNSVQLQQNSTNFLDVSGNLSADGLSILFEEHGTQYISDEAPESIAQLEEILRLYLKGDKQFKRLGFGSQFGEHKTSINKKTDYESWKVRYEAKQKIYKKKQRLTILFSIFLTALLTLFLYYYFTDELRFVGQEVEFGIATVISTEWKPVRSGFIQRVTYEFEYEGSKYNGNFRGTQLTGKHYVGDKIKVKFSKSNPSNCKRVASY